LTQHPNARVQVFGIWEPILVTDWWGPTSAVLGRLSDKRVTQFWDKDHVLAKRLAQDARDPQPKPNCCDRGGYLWDLAAVYPKGALWGATLPPAIVFDGPVVEVKDRIVETLAPR